MGEIIERIGLSGGPKAGKTVIKEEMRKMIERETNCKVIVVGETATEVIEAGILPMPKPKDNDPEKMRLYEETNRAFQQAILDLQMAKEKAFEELAEACPEDVIILYDRIVSDNEGYLKKAFGEELGRAIYVEMLKAYDKTPVDALCKYDLLLCFETSAKKKIFNIEDANDKTKRLEEDDREALIVDYWIKTVMEQHPNYVRIEAKDDFNEKVQEALDVTRAELAKRKGRCLVRKSS